MRRRRESAALQRAWRAARSPRYPIDQAINIKDSLAVLTPASEAPAVATRAGWDAVRSGQAIPLVYERVEVENADGTYGGGI